MAELNTKTSIVDFLKSTGKDSSPEARAKLAADSGIKDYVGSADQNTQLLKSMQSGGTAPTPTPAESGNNADALINGPMDEEIATFEQEDGPQTRGSVETVNEFMSNLQTTIQDTLGTRPEAESLSTRYQELRSEAGVSSLESRMTQLRNEQREIDAARRQRVQAQRGKQVATGVMAGRIGEIERQEMERLDFNAREQAYLNDQLTTSYNVINTIMGFEQQDYQNATASYDQRFTQAMSAIDLARGLRSDQISDEDREREIAAANLQVMYNAISSGGADIDELGSDTETMLTKLEVQAGLPVGFYKALKARADQAQIVSTSQRTDGNTAYTDFVMRNADGSMYIETIKRGSARSASSGSKSESGSGTDRMSFERWKETPEAKRLLDEEQEKENQSFTRDYADKVLREKYNDYYGTEFEFESMKNMTPAKKASFEAAGLLNAPANVQAFYDAAPNTFKSFYQQGVASGEIDFVPTVMELAEMQDEWEKLTKSKSSSNSKREI